MPMRRQPRTFTKSVPYGKPEITVFWIYLEARKRETPPIKLPVPIIRINLSIML
jgi:hypothetical protein